MSKKYFRDSLTTIHLAVAVQMVGGHFVLATSDIVKKWQSPIIMNSSGADLESTELTTALCELSEDWKFPLVCLVELRPSDSSSGNKLGASGMLLHADKETLHVGEEPWNALSIHYKQWSHFNFTGTCWDE